jgi:hypothetical protein
MSEETLERIRDIGATAAVWAWAIVGILAIVLMIKVGCIIW